MLEESMSLAKNRAIRYTDLFNAGKITIDQYLEATNYVNSLELNLLSAKVNYWKLRYSYWF